MFTIVGNCPKCGAPIYTYTAWWGVCPPPNMYSCYCFPQPSIKYSDSTDDSWKWKSDATSTTKVDFNYSKDMTIYNGIFQYE